jgi:hypoxia up-regulated 1
MSAALGLTAFFLVADAQIMSFDAGHEFFKVALMRPGAPLEIVLNGHSKRKTPTAVSYFDAIRQFGDDALAHKGKEPTKVPMFFHSFMGKNFTSAEAVKAGGEWWDSFAFDEKFYSFSLGYSEDRGVPFFNVKSDSDGFHQEEVFAAIINYARKLAEESNNGKPVRDLVVTVPADATLRQRQAIVAAGEIAGCRVLTLVHEGSAFAIQRAVDFQPPKGEVENILFYNIGSRKAEATIAKFESKQAGMVAGKTAPVVTILGSATDFGIGGHFLDLRLAKKMLSRFQEKNPKLAEGIASDPRALRKLLVQAQKTKAILSANKNAPFICESLYNDVDFQASLNRGDFERMIDDLLVKLTDPIERALASSNLTAADITMVEVVGGGWRVPIVQQRLSEYLDARTKTKLPLGQHLNGEEAAALAAALVGANQSTSFRVKKIFFTDTTAHAYSVQVASATGSWERNITKLFPVGAILGSKKKLTFSLSEDFAIRLFENGVLVAEYFATGLGDILEDKWSKYNLTGSPKVSVTVVLETSGLIELKVPTVTVEEAFWANVTKNSTKPGTGSENQTTPTSEVAEDVVLKLKKKKHEKKLTVERRDFKPLPLTADGIAAAKQRLEETLKEEGASAAAAALKNELESILYKTRDELETKEFAKVTTSEQREEVSQFCTECEEWMYTGSSEKKEYEDRLSKLRSLLGPIEERMQEVEGRSALRDAMIELAGDVKTTKAHIAKDMPWVSQDKISEASKMLSDLQEWWSKKKDQQAMLPLHEAPAFTKAEVMERITKVRKEWNQLKKTKKEKKDKTSTKEKATPAKDDVDLPSDIEETQKELDALPGKKMDAIKSENFAAVKNLKKREKQLKEHLARLNAQKSDL